MHRKLKIAGSCMAAICLTVCILYYLTNLMERKASEEKYADFFEQQEDFDVLFMGTSHVINAVFPMMLWNEYGIVSYNFGGHDNRIPTTYWVMKNALEYTNPKVVVIDCAELSSSYKCSNSFSCVHLSLDAFPLNVMKIRAIWDLLDDPIFEKDIENGTTTQSDEPRTKIGLLWDYSVYHSRWAEITRSDFEPAFTYEKGAESRIAVTRGQIEKIPADQKMEGGTTGDQYLRKMIEECQDRGIEVLLTYLPFPAVEHLQMEANYIYDVAEEYGVNYINFLDMELINYQTDLYDKSHVNPSGARKITDYLGRYLTSNYKIADQRKNGEYAFWGEDYNEYTELKNRNIAACDDMEVYLMLLAGDNVNATIDVRDKSIFRNAGVISLLENLGVNTNELTENTDFILIRDGGKKTVVINDFRDYDKSAVTELGEIRISYDVDGSLHDGETGFFGLYLDGEELLQGNMNEDINMLVSVRRDGVEVDTVGFAYAVDTESAGIVTIAANR